MPVGAEVVARNTRNEEREFTAKHAKCLELYQRGSIEIAPNDKLLPMANRSEPGFRTTNGELVTVARIDEQGRIHLQDGRVLPENYKQFTHGYAVTAHRSQGKSVDAVVISADGMRKDLFYVAASRGRENITVVTTDRNLLRESVARSEGRQSASELSRKVQQPSLESQQPPLRERELPELPVAHEQGYGHVPEGESLLRKASALEIVQTIDRENPSCDQKQEQIIEPAHYLGIKPVTRRCAQNAAVRLLDPAAINVIDPRRGSQKKSA